MPPGPAAKEPLLSDSSSMIAPPPTAPGSGRQAERARLLAVNAAAPPPDGCQAVYLIMCLQGAGMLFGWNMFITCVQPWLRPTPSGSAAADPNPPRCLCAGRWCTSRTG